MKKILVSLVIASSGGLLLGGCGFGPFDQSTTETPIVSPAVNQTATEPVVTAPAETPVVTPAITDASLEVDLQSLDAAMGGIKTTGFEATDLTDKDLGL